MEANVSLGIFDMGEFNYLSPFLIITNKLNESILNEFCRDISDKNGNYNNLKTVFDRNSYGWVIEWFIVTVC